MDNTLSYLFICLFVFCCISSITYLVLVVIPNYHSTKHQLKRLDKLPKTCFDEKDKREIAVALELHKCLTFLESKGYLYSFEYGIAIAVKDNDYALITLDENNEEITFINNIGDYLHIPLTLKALENNYTFAAL